MYLSISVCDFVNMYSPYHSREKGTVENTIGRIRRYIPKGTPLHEYTKQQIHWLEDKLNNTPRKRLGWKTPNEAMAEVLHRYKFSPPHLIVAHFDLECRGEAAQFKNIP